MATFLTDWHETSAKEVLHKFPLLVLSTNLSTSALTRSHSEVFREGPPCSTDLVPGIENPVCKINSDLPF